MTDKEKRDKWMQCDGSICPVCGSEHVENEDRPDNMAGGSDLYTPVGCNECHSEWTEHHKLTGYKLDKRGCSRLEAEAKWQINQ